LTFGYPAYRTAAFLSRSLPLSWTYWLGARLADLFYLASPGQRGAIRRNHLRIRRYRGLPVSERDLNRMTRETYQLFGHYMADFFRYSVSAKRGLEQRVELEGVEHLTAALAGGRGVLLTTAHIGNWELGGLILSLKGYPLTVAYRPMSSPRVNRMFLEQRRKRGLDPVPLGRAALGMVRALRQGQLAAVLADRDFSEDPFLLPFFGAPARLPRGPATLSYRVGSPLLPGFMLRKPDGNFRMVLTPAIDPGRYASAEALQGELVRVLERVIGEHATQWFIFEDFWAGSETIHP
jgi:KDO2-lipid IV(A) lauroyltransferase